jgi:hypothetical protein
MYGISSLKPTISITENTVECPVRECQHVVPRARRGENLQDKKFRCPAHGIFISPSTFEYPDRSDNFLRPLDEFPEDRALLDAIGTCKREDRLARERSEDAVTWNIFRFLETSGLLAPYLERVNGTRVTAPSLVYWSYCVQSRGVCPTLRESREEFGEEPHRSSEPDLLIKSAEHLIWIEAKLTSTNKTSPNASGHTKKYLSGG